MCENIKPAVEYLLSRSDLKDRFLRIVASLPEDYNVEPETPEEFERDRFREEIMSIVGNLFPNIEPEMRRDVFNKFARTILNHN